MDNAYSNYRQKNESIEKDQLAHPINRYGKAANNSENKGNFNRGQKPAQLSDEEKKALEAKKQKFVPIKSDEIKRIK